MARRARRRRRVMDADALAFIDNNRSAAMTTLRRDGTPHTVRVGIAVVDGKIWSSGTQSRLRTRHLRRDPRSTLFVFDASWAYLALECRVNIIEGPDVGAQSLRLFQAMQRDMSPPPSPGTIIWYGAQKTFDEALRLFAEEGRLIYEFDVLRSYGLYGAGTR
jgi:hypothetical protein